MPVEVSQILDAGVLRHRFQLLLVGFGLIPARQNQLGSSLVGGLDQVGDAALVGQAAGAADGSVLLVGEVQLLRDFLEHDSVGDDDHPLCPALKNVDPVFETRKEHRVQIFDHMGLIGLIGPGDEPAQRGGNPALFHNLGRVVLVAVKDNPLAPSGQFQSVWQQLGVVELIDVRVHLQRLLVDGLGAEEHPLQARGGVHRHLDDPHALFGGFPHRLRVLGLDHKCGVVARPCQRGALLMEDAGIIWRMGAGDMTNLHPFSLLSFDCFFSEGGMPPPPGEFCKAGGPCIHLLGAPPQTPAYFLAKRK